MRSLSLLLMIAGLVSAQPAPRTIEVSGSGTYRTLPDLGILTIEASVVREKFADAVKGLNTKTEQLTAQLQMTGFKKEEITTADYSVAKHSVWENNANVDKGYLARQTLSVEFPNTKERLAVILTSFMNSENDVRFSFSFTLSPSRESVVRDELLKRAVADARARAEVIAAAAQQKLGSVLRIRYRSSPSTPAPMAMMMKAESSGAAGFDVKEQTFTDDVTVEWELK